MRRALLLAAALGLAGCGQKTLSLPADPIDRAATCGVVAAAEARSATANIKAALPIEAQGRILHYALLAGNQPDGFSIERASNVSKRMPELEANITGGKWQDLAPACAAAYPETATSEVELPSGRYDALIGCDEVAHFLTEALERQEVQYGKELGDYATLRRKLESQITPGLHARAGSDVAKQQVERRKAMAGMVKRGNPALVAQQCVKKFG
ncbi:MAG: hypothetical protein E6G94_08460 [Alphaproteobacteria bacterium]|nr:MAG: hypothetical protein E6G94_08460 [Alphaproteobacteria bacterium]